jgi:hypothetical protein
LKHQQQFRRVDTAFAVRNSIEFFWWRIKCALNNRVQPCLPCAATKIDTHFWKALMKKYGNPAVPFWLLSIYGNRVMFQWQAVKGGGLNPTHRVRWDLSEFRLLTQTETFGPKLISNLKFWKTGRQLLESFFMKNICKYQDSRWKTGCN